MNDVNMYDGWALPEWEALMVSRISEFRDMAGFNLAIFMISWPVFSCANGWADLRQVETIRDTAITRIAAHFGVQSVVPRGPQSIALGLCLWGEPDLAEQMRQIHRAFWNDKSAPGELLIGAPEIGVSLHRGDSRAPQDGRTPGRILDDLVWQAEMALQWAHHHPEQGVPVFSPDMPARIRSDLAQRESLRRAVENQGFGVAYQPIVDLETGATLALEVLIRWPGSSELFPGGPAQFVALAEDMDLIGSIGEWQIDMVTRQVGEWRRAGLSPPRINVNVSRALLSDTRFIDRLLKCAAHHGLPAGAFAIEITERTLVSMTETVIQALDRLRAIGVMVAVDDFGTGYSALSCLLDMPVCGLKIDRSFIARLSDAPRDQAMVRSIMNIANSFDLETVAEGIETPDQLRILRMLGCRTGQGFLLSRPLSPERATAWIMSEVDGSRLSA